MKNLNRWVFILPLVNIICLIAIQPMVIGYFGMTSLWKGIYILIVFGSPIWVVVPIGLLMMLFAAWPNEEHETYWFKWRKLTRNSIIGASIILLLFSCLLLFSKWVLKNEPFPRTKYVDIVELASDCSDIKSGVFQTNYRYMVRQDSVQTEYSKNYNDTFVYRVIWIAASEYRLVNIGKSTGMNDTLDIKVTHNTKDYYEGFICMGEFAKYYRVMKVKRPQ